MSEDLENNPNYSKLYVDSRTTIIALTQSEEIEGGFTTQANLICQRENYQNDSVGMPVTDVVALALIDIIKKTPADFIKSLEGVQTHLAAAAKAMEEGADPEEAVTDAFGQEGEKDE